MYPSLVVFDLDFTLWDCGGTWCDCLSPPFRMSGERIVDRLGRVVRLYDEVHEILDDCDRKRITKALASRTEQPEWAKQLVDLLGITHRFELAEIYPSSKVRHFEALRKASGVEFDQMLFFDDEKRNIVEVGDLGVVCIHVDDGVTRRAFQEGLRQYHVSPGRRD